MNAYIKQLAAYDTIDQHSKSVLAAVINFFGDGDHAWAEANSIGSFGTEYAHECCQKAVASLAPTDPRYSVVMGLIRTFERESQ